MDNKQIYKFKDLPSIPSFKQWREDQRGTQEQDIGFKILDNISLSEEEENIFKEALSFYKAVITQMQKMDLSALTAEDFVDFKEYFENVFNFLPVVENVVSCGFVVRIVKNKEVFEEGKSIPNISFLSYPPLAIVQRNGRYNRANTSNRNAFYGTGSINASLLETTPESGELITVGVYVPKVKDFKMNSYPISHSKQARLVNQEVQKGYNAFIKSKENRHPLMMECLEIVFDFLGEEFSKPVNNHLEYFYSAIFSDRILTNSNVIVYPSVKCKYKYENLAIAPAYFDDNFQLNRIFEILVKDTFYDEEKAFEYPFEISYINTVYSREPKQICPDGQIIWD